MYDISLNSVFSTFMLASDFCEVVEEIAHEWDIIKYKRTIKHTNQFINNSCYLMKQTAFTKPNIPTFLRNFRMLFKYIIQMVVLQSFKVQLGELNDNLKCNKVNDTCFDVGLMGEEEDVHSVCQETDGDLAEAEHVGNHGTVSVKK